jgi:hypothetical protein
LQLFPKYQEYRGARVVTQQRTNGARTIVGADDRILRYGPEVRSPETPVRFIACEVFFSADAELEHVEQMDDGDLEGKGETWVCFRP